MERLWGYNEWQRKKTAHTIRRQITGEVTKMEFKNSYLQGVYETVQRRNAGEPEFLQAVREVLESFEPVLEKRP